MVDEETQDGRNFRVTLKTGGGTELALDLQSFCKDTFPSSILYRVFKGLTSVSPFSLTRYAYESLL